MLNPPQQKAFFAFYDSVHDHSVFDAKTSVLLALAGAMGLGCVPCMEYYLGEAEKAGISREEIGAVQAIVMAVSAGRVNAQFREAEKKVRHGND